MGSKEDIARAVEAAFQESREREYVTDYLESVRTNLREAESRLVNIAIFMLLVGAIGELTITGGISEISLSGAKIQRPSFIALSAPVIIAYLYLQLQDLTLAATLYQDVHDAVMKKCFPKLHQRELAEAIYPTSILGVPMATAYRTAGSLSLKLVADAKLLVVSLAPPAFIAVYYSQLLRSPHSGYLYISIAMTAILVAASAGPLLGAVRGHLEWRKSQ
jgi:hypothetical protein